MWIKDHNVGSADNCWNVSEIINTIESQSKTVKNKTNMKLRDKINLSIFIILPKSECYILYKNSTEERWIGWIFR